VTVEILEFALGAALIWAVAALVFLYVVCKVGWDELRSGLLNRAYKSFTFDGHVLPGMRPHPVVRLVIRVLSPEDDERKQLVLEALAPEQPEPQRSEPLPGVLEHPRSFAVPVRAGEFRARRTATD
jgi:hypothetical protein